MADAVNVSEVPNTTRRPLAYIQIDDSRADIARTDFPSLIVGRMDRLAANRSISDSDANKLIRVLSTADANRKFGEGTPLAKMAEAYFQNDPGGLLWALPQHIAASSTQAWEYDFTNTSQSAFNEADYYTLTIDDLPPVTLPVGDAADAATAIAAFIPIINARKDLPIVASSATNGFLCLTWKVNGRATNKINLIATKTDRSRARFSPEDENFGGDDILALTAAGAIGDEPFDYIICESHTQAYYDFIQDLLDPRWGAMQGLYGHAFFAETDANPANIISAVSARNYAHMSVIGVNSPTPEYTIAAAVGATAARELRAHPARPLQTLPVKGITPSAPGQNFTNMERNNLLNNKIATLRATPGGEYEIERITTTYNQDSDGNPSDAWFDVTTPATIAAFIRGLIANIASTFPRARLVDDSTRRPVGGDFVTPGLIKAHIVRYHRLQEDFGLVENTAAFAEALIVERDSVDRNRVNAYLPANLANQFRIFAGILKYEV